MRVKILAIFILSSVSTFASNQEKLSYPDYTKYTNDKAARMISQSKGRLSPVYAPLAEYIADKCKLSQIQGVGIDLGSGPGSLILELCKHTELYWINADINPHFFGHFYKSAARENVTHRVGAIFADSHYLPFRDNFAQVVVSRGSYHFWSNKEKAFAEIYRILKPGGTAFIGRGFPPNLELGKAEKIRASQNFSYDVKKSGEELNNIMRKLNISNYEIIYPKPNRKTTLNYGVWVKFSKEKVSDINYRN